MLLCHRNAAYMPLSRGFIDYLRARKINHTSANARAIREKTCVFIVLMFVAATTMPRRCTLLLCNLLCNLLCAIFNSRPSEELTFQLSHCYFAASAAWRMCGIWRINIGVWPTYAAGIGLGQLMHVLCPLCNLVCAIINSRPSEELTLQLIHCHFAASAA